MTPMNLSKQVEYADRLPASFVHAIVDFCDLDGEIVFGEITFFHGGGFEKFTPEEYGVYFGDNIDIDKIKENEAWS